MKKIIFFRLLIVVFLLVCSVNNIYAQYAGATFDSGPSCNIEILQVENREFSTMVFMAYTTENADNWKETSNWMNIGDKTFIRVEGSNKKYHMISTINMPINNEAENRYMLFDRKNQRHQFVLEFEKIPDGKTFDIIEKENDNTGFNFYGVKYTPTEPTSFINIDDFISDYPVKEFGRIIVEGKQVTYIKYNDVIINAIPLYIEQYGKYYNINISVQNFSNRSILFDPSKINIKGYKLKKKKKDAQGPTIDKTIDMEILSNVEYDKIVRRKQSWNNFMVAMTESANVSEVGHSYSTTTQTGSNIVTNNSQASAYIGNTYGYASANSSSYTTTYGQSTNHSYNGTEAYLAQQKANENIQEFENSQRQIRERINDGYVKMHTIPSKSEYTGFFNVKYKNIDHLQMTIVIDDETYEFMF